jgi:translocation and assembly module TamA
MKDIPAKRSPINVFQAMSDKRVFYSFWVLAVAIFLVIASLARAEDQVKIIVKGVEGDAKKNVLGALSLPQGLVKEGHVDRQWLTRFIRQAEKNIPTSLEPFGFYQAQVSIALEVPRPDELLVQVDVQTGPPAILTDVDVSITGPGGTEESLLALARNFPLKKGDIPYHLAYEQGKRNLESHARRLGYLDAIFTKHEILIDEAATSAQIRLVLETGEKYYFSSILIEGAPDYPDAFLRRYLPFAPGDVFSQANLDEAQRQLYNSERFRDVTVTAEKDQAENHQIPVRILLAPLPRQSLKPGVGYGTDTGARFSMRYRNLNLFHRGHELNSNLYLAEHLQGLGTRYIIPSSTDIRTFTSVQLNFQREDISTYVTSFVALELSQTNSFSASRQGTAYLRFQQEDFTISSQSSISRYVLPGIRFSDTSYDNLVRPTRGFRYTLDLRGTHNLLGSTTHLLQLIVEASHVLTLPLRLSVLTGARIGITFFSDPLTDLPPSLRFFAGGDQSVRGYAYQSLGPRDSTGQVVGGKHLLTGHIDLQRAVFDDWAISVFYNAGNAFDTFNEVRLFQAVGMGLHYYTPVGALNLFAARQIQKDDPEFRFHFTVGFEF